MAGFTQWSRVGENFFPAGVIAKQLPPGFYNVCESMSGIFFQKKSMKVENLLRFPDSQCDMVINEINKFWGLENKFNDSGLPFKRGILMYGPPGSGKTTCIRIVVDDLIREHQGIVIEFGGVSLFKSGYEIIREIHKDMPMIVLMEDVDSIMNRYDSSEILNLLDGMYGINKVVFMATTNYPERLKSNIMNRPTRFDKKVFVGMPSEEARRIFISNKLVGEDKGVIEQWVNDTDGLSIAHIKELYIANRILQEPYGIAIENIRRIGEFISSNEFDKYTKNQKLCTESKKPVNILEHCGSGNVYKFLKKKFRGAGSGPESIAALIEG